MRQQRPLQSESIISLESGRVHLFIVSLTFGRLLSGPLVDVYVGANRKHWCIHRNVLCHHSEYFNIELGGDTKKLGSKTSKLELLEDDPLAFEFLVKWLYQGKIDDVTDLPMEQKWDHAETCQKLYFLCDRVKMPVLKNLAIDQFRKGCNEAGLVPGPEEMRPVYEKTPANSPFRKLVSKIAARQIMDPESEKDAASYRDVFQASPDFAIDVVNAIRKGAGGKLLEDPTATDHCSYHQHENGETCKKSVRFKGLKPPPSPQLTGDTEEPPKVNGLTVPSNLQNGLADPDEPKPGSPVKEAQFSEPKRPPKLTSHLATTEPRTPRRVLSGPG